MANKSILRVQVSLRRVVDFNEDQSGQNEKSASNDKTVVQITKGAKTQSSR